MGLISSVLIPRERKISNYLNKVDFGDAYQTNTSRHISAEDAYLAMFNHVPKWGKKLMVLRNWIVGRLGLKTEKTPFTLTKDDLYTGNQIKSFKVHNKTSNEIIVGLNDTHLNFRVSVLSEKASERTTIALTTIVKYNNRFGKVYMSCIKPFHKLIVKSMLKNLHKL